MYIEITFELEKETFDIYIDERQQIGSIIKVLKESGKIENYPNVTFYKSKLNENTFYQGYTFKEANILTGDHITACFERGEK